MTVIQICITLTPRNTVDWNYLRTFEAVARAGSLTGAARLLGISQPTVTRHLMRLEESAGSPLMLRQTPVLLTRRGEELLEAVRPMVDAALIARSRLDARPSLHGTVSLTTVGEVIRWSIAPKLANFYDRHPNLTLELLVSNEIASLAAGEADIAIRLARPARGDLIARRIQTETYGFFASTSCELSPETPWLGLGGALANISDQALARRAFEPRTPRLLVEDLETLGRAVEQGLGAAVLPRRFTKMLDGVVEISPESVGSRLTEPLPDRHFWLVVHAARQRVPKIRAVLDWLIEELTTDDTVPVSISDSSPHNSVG